MQAYGCRKNVFKFSVSGFNEIWEFMGFNEIIFKFKDQLTPSDSAFFHERVRLLVIALQYNWRVAAANASGTNPRNRCPFYASFSGLRFW